MGGKDNATAFTAVLKGFVNDVKVSHDKIVREVAFDLRDNVIVGGPYSPGTPVDTGFARANWWMDVNDRGGTPPNLPQGESLPAGAVQQGPETIGLAITGLKAGDVFGLNNGAEYIEALEFGHSGQAPEGMVRVTVAAGQDILDQAVKRVASGSV